MKYTISFPVICTASVDIEASSMEEAFDMYYADKDNEVSSRIEVDPIFDERLDNGEIFIRSEDGKEEICFPSDTVDFPSTDTDE